VRSRGQQLLNGGGVGGVVGREPDRPSAMLGVQVAVPESARTVVLG
jgi:hypothetical protein